MKQMYLLVRLNDNFTLSVTKGYQKIVLCGRAVCVHVLGSRNIRGHSIIAKVHISILIWVVLILLFFPP